MTLNTSCKELAARIFGSPERDRLNGAIEQTKTEFAQIGADAAGGWKVSADTFLAQAEDYSNKWNLQQGWVSLMAAHRAILINPNDPGRVRRAAMILRRETEKITGWRAKAIEDLLCGFKKEYCEDCEGGGTKAAEPDVQKPAKDEALSPEMCKRVIEAIALRDDQASTTYFKIQLRRRSLFQLFLALWFGLILVVVLSAGQVLPCPFDDVGEVTAVIIFGVLGAVLSVGQGLLTTDLSVKIPSQQIGSFVVWMRPGIGAVAALAAFSLIHANETLNIFNSAWTKDFNVIAVLAFAAGFSERFIVGAIERISQSKS